MTREDLQAISELMDEKLKPINERLDKMDQRLDTIEEGQAELKEGQAEIRSGVNTLLRWAEKVGDSIDFPLPKII